ncbi:UNVERIFIED_ORG: hypothetical protein J2Y78_004903 [Buttiauxella agrestis ATCC 33320]
MKYITTMNIPLMLTQMRAPMQIMMLADEGADIIENCPSTLG